MEFKLQSLEDGFAVIKTFCQQQQIPDEECYKINLVSEELIVNLLKYTGAGKYFLELSRKNNSTVIRLCYTADEFNPTHVPEKERENVEKMEYGGLGLYLVNSVAKEVKYHYDEKKSLNDIEIIV